ncbi:solute carrier family 22 member 16-like [Dermacentor andersoni]|uniref:solute carrier family 22 member 16-like n=1 Tax=Dermacentor andersoni TaxID=34620 RepID=UPI003B3B8F7E
MLHRRPAAALVRSHRRSDMSAYAIPEWGLAPMQRLLAFLVACSNFFLALNTVGSAFVLPGGLSFRCGNNSSDDPCEVLRRGGCNRVEFEYSVVYGAHTAVNEFQLVCDRRWLAASCHCLAMAGLALGALAFGRIADRWGRRVALLWGAGVHAAGSLAAAAAPSAAVYAFSRLVTSLGAASAPSLDVLLVESLVPALRCTDTAAVSLGFSLGAICAAWLTPTLSTWRSLHALMLVYAAIVFACTGLLPESPRWLLSRGRLEEARAAVRRTARFNGLPRGKVQLLVHGLGCEEGDAAPQQHIFQSCKLRSYTIFMWFQGAALGMSYYSSSLTSTEIGSRPQLDFSLLHIVELGCNLVGCAVVSRLPRRLSLTLLALALAAAHALLALAAGRYALHLASAVLVKGLVSSQVLLCMLHVQESYPTCVRALGVSTFQCVCWAAASLEPFARVALGRQLPVAYAVVLAAWAVGAPFLLPETLSASLDERKQRPTEGDDEPCQRDNVERF